MLDGTIGGLPFLYFTKGVLHLDAANGADIRWYSGIRCAAPPGGVFVRSSRPSESPVAPAQIIIEVDYGALPDRRRRRLCRFAAGGVSAGTGALCARLGARPGRRGCATTGGARDGRLDG